MDRRDFLKKAFQMGGVAALYRLGVSVEQARAFGVLPAVVGSESGGSSWTAWDESSEDTLSVDQDGDGTEDTFVIFGEGGNSANETGRGAGLAGADLVWTQNGAIAGNGSYRTLDGTDDYFTLTETFCDWFDCGTSSFAVILKLEDWNENEELEQINWNGGTKPWIIRGDSTAHKLGGYVENTQLTEGANTLTPNAHPTSGVLYVYLGGNGSETILGFTTTKPTKKSDLAANDRIVHPAGLSLSVVGGAHAAPYMFTYSATTRNWTCKWHYAVFCNTDPLIDFNA